MHIIGTAGHVDHGKSSLVAALTGTNPDRWAEEQLRGMTLDLGFAHLQLPDGVEAGIVDVPGHERFLHNMLAGASGMELLLLVIAANEGVRPQTVEHVQILRYLNVQRTIVVLSKSDLLSAKELDLVESDVRFALHDTLAADARYVRVSSATGDGLDTLRASIAAELGRIAPRNADAPVYLPIDRVFTLPGRGTIVTGTLMQGSLAPGDLVAIEPRGKQLRVRGLHVFGHPRERATGGMRVALNLPGIETAELARGDVVASPDFASQSSFSVRFRPLESALALMRRRMPVRAYIGAAEIMGTLVFDRPPHDASEVTAQLHLREPVLAFPGVRFVVRRPSPKTLLGGGEVEGACAATTTAEAPNAIENMLLTILRGRGFAPSEIGQIAFLANLREEIAAPALEALAQRGELLRIERPSAFVDATAAREILSRVLERLARGEAEEPWALGVTSLGLSRELDIPEPLLVRTLAAFGEDGRIAKRAGYYATIGHQPSLTDAQKAFFDRTVAIDRDRPLVPGPYDTLAAAIKSSSVPGVAKAYETLLARGALVKVGDDLYLGSQIATIHQRIAAYINEHGRMTMAEFRDAIGTSRKYAVPLLEWFDGHGITIRNGDYRTLRRKGETPATV